MREITAFHIDALRELINIGVGRAAGVLNEMVRSQVSLNVPYVKVLTSADLRREMNALGRDQMSTVKLGFSGPFSGMAALLFPPDSASKLVEVLTGEETGTPDLDSVRAGTLSEVGNILINGVMGSIGNVLKRRIDYTLPAYVEDSVENLFTGEYMGGDHVVLLVRTRFMVRQLQIEGDITILFGMGSFDTLLSAIEDLREGL